MKRLFLLIAVCMIGMVLPQRMWAGVVYSSETLTITTSEDGKTVTIHSDKAGALDALNFNGNNHQDLKNAITAANDKIIFEGYFCEGDLNKLKGGNGGNAYNCYTQSTVDMSEAHFVNYGDDANNHTNNYNSMSFQKWGSNVTTAITSKYMGTNDSASRDFLYGCTNLTTLTLSSGQFPGLNGNNNELTTVNVKEGVTNLGQGMFSGKTSITTVNFEDGDQNLTIGEGCFNGCTGITTLALPARLYSIGKQAFANTTGVTSLSFSENSRFATIPEGAFLCCGNNDEAELKITIPRSVTLIESGAFAQMYRLKEIKFTGQSGDSPLVIKGQAFSGGEEKNYTISDVFVDVNPQDRKLICEYNAFPFVSLVGQTDITNDQKATLHFSEAYWDYYAGDWKRGLTFDKQEALNGIKDGCVVSNGEPHNAYFDKGPTDVENSNGYVTGRQPANGWHQFAVTSTNIDIIIPPGEFIRTYSTSKAYDLPDHVRIFRVINFTDGYAAGMDANNQALADAAPKTAITQEVFDYIPKNTGLIMVGNVSSAVLYYFKENSGTVTYPHTKHDVSNPSVANLLEPTLDNDKYPLAPVWRDDKNEIEYRNFGMLKTDHKFGRAKVTTMRKNYAYLKIPAELFHWKNESAANGGSNNGVDDPTNAPAKISVLYMFDDINEDNFGIATAIKNAINKEIKESNSYYTLQGVKVSAPTTKGVYIVNGKKVIIK